MTWREMLGYTVAALAVALVLAPQRTLIKSGSPSVSETVQWVGHPLAR